MAKYIFKAFLLTTFPSTQKKCPKIYAVTLVLPLKIQSKIMILILPSRTGPTVLSCFVQKINPKPKVLPSCSTDGTDGNDVKRDCPLLEDA